MSSDDESPPDQPTRAGQAQNVRAAAEANADATFGDGAEGTKLARIPGAGLVTGEVGPKGRASSQLRALSRIERTAWGSVPRGTAFDGGGRYILALVVGIVVACAAVVALLWWATS